MKKRILIANRGEIASRIARAVHELGHVAIGLYTDGEPEAAHLEYCDEWVHLSGSSMKESFLSIENIIETARKYKADAIHPGYGFLSENSNFAKAVEDAGIVFIGPSSKCIHQMGDKAISKQFAKKAGVPTVPGSVGAVESVNEALQIAKEIGFPVLMKAVAGGGGRGMRVCNSAEEVIANFETIKREAKNLFGNDGMLVEKYIQKPHHIEVQILADKKGNVFHFFERECSVQRRHQKIIEEAPSPFIGQDEQLRKEICETAVRLAKAVGYDSAGTVEFIMGDDRKFYFLEMNTRIQVEHPITEEISGVDLIVCMIHGAFGEEMGIPNQEWITKTGFAIECRICAEDPVTMLPAPGKVIGFETLFPQGVRFDHCLYQGLHVTPDFDPMVGKLITHGITREVAVRKMRTALNGLMIEGLKTNIELHKIILNENTFSKGKYTTNYMNEIKPQEKVVREFSEKDARKRIAVIEAKGMGL